MLMVAIANDRFDPAIAQMMAAVHQQSAVVDQTTPGRRLLISDPLASDLDDAFVERLCRPYVRQDSQTTLAPATLLPAALWVWIVCNC